MNNFTVFLETKFAPALGKIGSNQYIQGLRDGMITTIPFTIIGSFFLIAQQLPIPFWQTFVEPYKAMLGAGNTMTNGIIALYVAFAIGYNMGKQFKQDALMAGMISFVGFMFLQIGEDFAVSTKYFGSKGIFTAIVIAILVAKTMEIFNKNKWYIKFPKGVPSAVEKSFAALTPTLFLLVTLWFLRTVLHLDITAVIITIFSPLVFALNTLPGILVFIIVSQLLWTCGIHGMSVVNAVGAPIFLTYLTANSEAFLAGAEIPYITATGFISNFVSLGGAGATLGLVIIMAFSKEKSFKTLGRLSFAPGLFNINEPVIFGTPVVMNPIIMIPFVLVDIVLVTGTYILMYFDIIAKPIANVPWVTPPIIGAYLLTGGNIPAAIWAACALAISVLIYLPFFRILEKQRLANVESED